MPEFDPVEFLVSRRFPATRTATSDVAWVGPLDDRSPAAIELERELRTKPQSEVDALVANEHAKLLSELETSRFFNKPSASADWPHWSKAAHWTLDEAVALSFGKAPELVSWETVKSHVKISKFAFEYSRRRDLASRAKSVRQLFDPVFPRVFLAWAKRIGLDFPAELETAVSASGHSIEDWESMLRAERAAHEETKKSATAKIEEAYEWGTARHAEAIEWGKARHAEALEVGKASHADALEMGRITVEERNKEIAELLEEISRLKSAQQTAAGPNTSTTMQSLRPRERDSLLKLVIGMAVRGYTYDPAALKNQAVKDIANDLDFVGVGLDEDTVRKYLQEAKQLIPRD